MPPKSLCRMLLMLGTLTVLSCKGAGPSGPSAAGSWSGASGSVSLDMTLTESGQSVNGSGSLVVSSNAYGVSISGSLIDTTVSLTLTAGGYQPVAYSAALSGGTMTGSLSGSGFPGSSLTVTRQ